VCCWGVCEEMCWLSNIFITSRLTSMKDLFHIWSKIITMFFKVKIYSGFPVNIASLDSYQAWILKLVILYLYIRIVTGDNDLPLWQSRAPKDKIGSRNERRQRINHNFINFAINRKIFQVFGGAGGSLSCY
jgi:hypothetical protein